MSSLRMPAEHGAWGILIVPFFSAALVATGNPRAAWTPALLAAMCVLGIFLLRGSLEAYRDWRALLLPSHLALGALTAAAGLTIVVGYQRYELVALAGLGAGLYVVQLGLARSHNSRSEKRSLTSELFGVAVLTLSAPAASIAATGSVDGQGARVWFLNLLFFAGGVLYVKYRVRGVLAHRPFPHILERMAFAWPVFVYHLLLGLFLIGAVSRESASMMLLLAFAPAILRAMGLLFQLGRRFPIKRLGWTEVAHSVLFAVLLVLAVRQ